MNNTLRSFLPNWALVVAMGAAVLVAGVSIGAFEYADYRAERLLAAREATIAEEELKLLEDLYQEEGHNGLIRAVSRRAALPSDNLGMVAIVDQGGALGACGRRRRLRSVRVHGRAGVLRGVEVLTE